MAKNGYSLSTVVEKVVENASDIEANRVDFDTRIATAVPIGTISMFAQKAVPVGYIDLCVPSPTFNVATYPDLAKLYPDGVLPSFLNRYPKGLQVSDAATPGDWMIPEHTHSTNLSHNHTATQAVHSHDKGTMNITGEVSQGADHRSPYSSGAFVTNGGLTNNGYDGTVAVHRATFNANRTWSGRTSEATPAITVNALGNTATKSSGILEAISKGAELDVDFMGVTFAIKAAGGIADGGLLEAAGVIQDVEFLRNEVVESQTSISTNTSDILNLRNLVADINVDYKAVDASLSQRISSTESVQSKDYFFGAQQSGTAKAGATVPFARNQVTNSNGKIFFDSTNNTINFVEAGYYTVKFDGLTGNIANTRVICSTNTTNTSAQGAFCQAYSTGNHTNLSFLATVSMSANSIFCLRCTQGECYGPSNDVFGAIHVQRIG